MSRENVTRAFSISRISSLLSIPAQNGRQGGENASLDDFLRNTEEKQQEGTGGERGIRTLGRVSPTHAFQACSFNHSDISPRECERVAYRDAGRQLNGKLRTA